MMEGRATDKRAPPEAVSWAGLALSREGQWLAGLLLLALLIRVATLGAYPLMDNTEARYAEIARKMVETGDWLMPQFRYGVPFWSKPPLSTWLAAIAYLGLGINEFAARLPSLLVCLPVAGMTYALAAQRDGTDAGLRAAVVLVTTPLFFVSAGAVMTDPALVLGTMLSMTGFWQAMTRTGTSARLWGYAFFAGLAIGLLAKGPVALVLTLPPIGVWTLWRGGIGNVWRRLPWITGSLLTIVLSVPWYVLAEQRTPGFLDYFLIGEHWKRYTQSGWKGDMFGTAHSRPRGMIWPLAIAATLPWSAFWIALQVQAWRTRSERPSRTPGDGWRPYCYLWMLTPLVFFTFAGNILFTYVLPGLPAFALLAAETWYAVGDKGGRAAALRYAGLVIPIGIALGTVFVLPQIASTNSHEALIGAYLAKRGSDARLIYLSEAPHSAEFYARGKVTTLPTGADLEPYLRDAPRDFFALTGAQANAMPEIVARLKPVARFGRYTLFAEELREAAAPR
jgi:4-amino-4-deoxy-L-arabinose transferase-like glycosyltransferase